MLDDPSQRVRGEILLQDFADLVIDEQVHFLLDDMVKGLFKQLFIQHTVLRHPIGMQGMAQRIPAGGADFLNLVPEKIAQRICTYDDQAILHHGKGTGQLSCLFGAEDDYRTAFYGALFEFIRQKENSLQ